MSAEAIEAHFRSAFGNDVAVSFDDPSDPRVVVLFRPDRIPEAFAADAFSALEDTHPDLAARIDQVLVSYKSRLGPMRHRVPIRMPVGGGGPETGMTDVRDPARGEAAQAVL